MQARQGRLLKEVMLIQWTWTCTDWAFDRRMRRSWPENVISERDEREIGIVFKRIGVQYSIKSRVLHPGLSLGWRGLLGKVRKD